ncbi:DUF6059 family protein [Streptomyces sp. NPDC096339]|uniref:DUF6059 family protein n=1 Tax=Streptomyces sp. NPDC096339 TaxID=3366086 RepID=UPI00380DC00E
MPSFMLRCLKGLGRWLVAAGALWLPPQPAPEPRHPYGPPPDHPERLIPSTPLTETERVLRAELPGWP